MRLGQNQISTLRAIADPARPGGEGRYSLGCGMAFGTRSHALRVLASLVRRGLLRVDSEPSRYHFAAPGDVADVWYLTDAGRAALVN